MVSQSDSGKAWEYGLARQLAEMCNRYTRLEENKPYSQARKAHGSLSRRDRNRIQKAAGEAVEFLKAFDPRLLNARIIEIQPDQKGEEGDVRDILIRTKNNDVIGISSKHRNKAIKHSRLSNQIDFGKEWYGIPCSQTYWNSVKPVWDRLSSGKYQTFGEIPDKWDVVYVPVLRAFIDEVFKYADPKKLLHYLLGRYDFYKVIKDNGNIVLQSFNVRKTLMWGYRLPMPKRIIDFSLQSESKTTAILTLDKGWQLSFRIHNADGRVIPSLKFDVQLVGNPQQLSRHEIPYR